MKLKNHHIIGALLVCCMLLGLLPAMGTTAQAASVSSIPSGYTGIYTANDLDSIRNDLDGNYILMNNIDLSSWGNWTPIGTGWSGIGFTGTFDGNGYAIKHMVIDDSSVIKDYNGGYQYAGLFATLKGATVKNIRYISGSISCENSPCLHAGAVAGCAYGSTISRCASYVNISYKYGEPDGNVVLGTSGIAFDCGGIVGHIQNDSSLKCTTISECENHAMISGISGSAPMEIGGIVGDAFTGEVIISDCYNIASLQVDTDNNSSDVGGILGSSLADINISNCYNIGMDFKCKVGKKEGISSYSNVGGIAGSVAGWKGATTIKNCYYVDECQRAEGYVTSNWNYTAISAEMCNTSAMQKQSTYSGFDFNTVWKMGSGSYPYPIFKWMESSVTTIEPGRYTVTFNANGGDVSTASKIVSNGEIYGELPKPNRSGYSFDGWFTSNIGGENITSTTTVTQTQNHTLYAHWTSAVDPYNLGDETYSFSNFGDSDSLGGHCFGMSITSAGYHNNLLDIREIGGDNSTPLYSFSKTQTVTQPICYYQSIQGSYSTRATVAGGSFYLNEIYDIASDWQAVVNYVSNHTYDDAGMLQIGYRKDGEGGHAINFLRYENVNGQDRIYAYDNNFPNKETYFYQDSSGRVWQAPEQTFSGAIDCIVLRNCGTYLNSVGAFDATHVLYMAKDAASVQGDYAYSYMDAGFSDEEYVMYEIPVNVDSVIIIPHRDNAEFIYMDAIYSFGEVTDKIYGKLLLASVDDSTDNTDASFQTFEGTPNPFTDVSRDAYYYDAVLWAVENGITQGTSATTFSPNADCTRAQIVTFLWRANGSPEPDSMNNPFKDVKADDYYYKAVL